MGYLDNPLLPIEGQKSASGLILLILFFVAILAMLVLSIWLYYFMFKVGLEARKEQKEIKAKKKLEASRLIKKDD